MWRARKSVEIPQPAPEEMKESEEPATRASKPELKFFDELRRREELMNAGFVGGKRHAPYPNEAHPGEKEIVIELPKEAYDIKDPE